MAHRALEVLIVALLVIATVGAVFQFQNHQLLRDILAEMRADPPRALARADDPERPTPPAPVARDEARGPESRTASPPMDERHEPRPVPRATTAGSPEQPRPEVDEPSDPAASSPPPLAAATDPAEDEPTLNVGGLGRTLDPLAPTAPRAPGEQRPPTSADRPAPKESPRDPSAAARQPAEPDAEHSPEWEEHGEVVLKVVEQLLGGEYAKVVERFNSLMARNLTEAELAAAIDPERARYGGLERILSHRSTTEGVEAGLTMFEVETQLTSGQHLSFTITLDERQRICGLLMK